MRSLFCTALLIPCGLFFLSFPTSVPAATFTVQIANYFYSPTNSTISPGDTIQWTNTSVLFHDARSTNNVWASPQLPPNGTYAFTFTNAGYYPYFCFTHRVQNPHTGTVSVVTATTNLPSITVQPTNQTVSSGSIASFDVTAGGPGPFKLLSGFIDDLKCGLMFLAVVPTGFRPSSPHLLRVISCVSRSSSILVRHAHFARPTSAQNIDNPFQI